MYILDTNHVIALENGTATAQKLIQKWDTVSIEPKVITSIISYKEQIAGCLASINRKKITSDQSVKSYKRLQLLLRFYCGMTVLEFDADAEKIFQNLRKVHPRTSANDLKIASIALANDAVLLTQNIRDFESIERLSVEDWIAL